MDRRIEIALDLIKSSYAYPLRERIIAGRLRMSPSRFRLLFKQATNQTLPQYFRTYRMARAADMMKSDPTLSIKQVAYALGYKYISAFDRDFRRCFGVSPRQSISHPAS